MSIELLNDISYTFSTYLIHLTPFIFLTESFRFLPPQFGVALLASDSHAPESYNGGPKSSKRKHHRDLPHPRLAWSKMEMVWAGQVTSRSLSRWGKQNPLGFSRHNLAWQCSQVIVMPQNHNVDLNSRFALVHYGMNIFDSNQFSWAKRYQLANYKQSE